MKPEFSDELISAFLDGELTADEQALVEQQLLDSPEHRKMFAELRALRESLQKLPNYQLDGQFHQRVMKKAERAMLSDAEQAGSETGSTRKQKTRRHRRKVLRRHRKLPRFRLMHPARSLGAALLGCRGGCRLPAAGRDLSSPRRTTFERRRASVARVGASLH